VPDNALQKKLLNLFFSVKCFQCLICHVVLSVLDYSPLPTWGDWRNQASAN
jgi:hypothetical protein